MSVHIRPADLADATAIAEVQVTAWRESYADILPRSTLDALSVAQRTASWTRQLTEAAARILVAETESGLIGFGACCPQRTGQLLMEWFDGEVSALYVLRAWQGQGHGKGLLNALFGRLREDGFEAVSLWVLSQNQPARAFYARMGGAVIAGRDDQGGDERLAETAYGWRKLPRGPARPLFTP